MKTLHLVSASLLAALGVVHTALTPVFYGRFSLGALWFAGLGLAMMFVGFLNIMLSRGAGRDRLSRILCYVSNVLVAGFGALIVNVDHEPLVILGLVLILVMTVAAFLLPKEAM